MRKHTIIEHDTFKQILQYRPTVTDETDRNTLKMTMLRSIIHAIGEKWARMKDETKSALEYLCFLSIERGFVYAGSKHVSERYDIDSSTVRRCYIAFLEKKGVIKRLWRSSTKHNGRVLADEICALAYSIAHKQFGQMKRERQPEIVETVEQKPVRTEALPDWFDNYVQSFNAYCENIKKEQEEKVTQDEIEELRKRLAQYA